MRLLLLAMLVGGCGEPSESSDVGFDAPGSSDGGLDAGAERDGGSTDAGPVDADVDAGSDSGVVPGPSGPVLYPVGSRHSPITPDIAAGLSAVDATGLDVDALMKVGDSITVSSAFLRCFEGGSVDLDGRPLDATLARFHGFARDSLSATVGWSAFAPLRGDPTPLAQEHAATSARFATVMFGTNDAGFRSTQDFSRDMWDIVDALLARGTIPLLSTVPPRDDMAAADTRVGVYNLAVRALAQGRGVPLIDLHRELVPLPDHGLGGDGVHPTVDPRGGCRLDAAGLTRGYNLRNLLTLEQLDRAARATSGEALDASAPRLRGAGTRTDPHEIEALPFAAMGDTSTSTSREIDTYGCATANESGPERFYRLELSAPARITARAISQRDVDVDVHLLRGDASGTACVARDDIEASVDAEAGVWWVAVDTFVGSAERAGEFLIVVE